MQGLTEEMRGDLVHEGKTRIRWREGYTEVKPEAEP